MAPQGPLHHVEWNAGLAVAEGLFDKRLADPLVVFVALTGQIIPLCAPLAADGLAEVPRRSVDEVVVLRGFRLFWCGDELPDERLEPVQRLRGEIPRSTIGEQ